MIRASSYEKILFVPLFMTGIATPAGHGNFLRNYTGCLHIVLNTGRNGKLGEIMKELKKQLYKLFCIRWDEFLILLIVELCAFAFGEIILKIVVSAAGTDDEVFPAGVVTAVITIAFVISFISLGVVSASFNLAVSMCSTRRRFVSAYLLVSYLEFLAVAITAYLLHLLELWILRTAYPGMRNESDIGVIFQWDYILVAGLAIVAVHITIGTLFLKFGKISIAVIWALWMLASQGGPRLYHSWDSYRNTAFVKMCMSALGIVTITKSGVLAGIAGLSIMLIFISWLMLRKQQVKM